MLKATRPVPAALLSLVAGALLNPGDPALSPPVPPFNADGTVTCPAS